MNQEIVAVPNLYSFHEQCQGLLGRGYTVISGSVCIARLDDIGNETDVACIAFFDPPMTSTFVPDGKGDACLAKEIYAEVYGGTGGALVPAIKEWLADPDTARGDDETITSLADAWIEAAHRES